MCIRDSCDRMGAAVPDGQGGYRLISGNEMGVLLFDYIFGGGVNQALRQLTTQRKTPLTEYTLQCEYSQLTGIEALLEMCIRDRHRVLLCPLDFADSVGA